MQTYFDHNATSPLHPEVLEAILPFLNNAVGNASSPHSAGRAARSAIETARGQVAELVNCPTDSVIFTSGGSEANNLLLKGFLDPTDAWQTLKEYMIFEWEKMDAWYEEEEEVFVHLRDPYHRVDILKSSRHVRVVVGEHTVAETRRPLLLFETGFPTRYYFPREDVRMDFLEPSTLKTRCPYKGIASSYWSIKVGDKILENSVWSYQDPLPEAYKIKDYLCFYNERVEAIYLNGELVPKPNTPWS